jgi:hypothetical protein
MNKPLINGSVLLILGVIGLIVYIVNQKYLHVNLSTADKVKGIVLSTKTRSITKSNSRWSSTKRFFILTLSTSQEVFAIDRTGEGTSDLEIKIRPGDTLELSYTPKYSSPNTNVFEIKKRDQVLESYEAYKKREGEFLGLLLFASIILLAASIFTYLQKTPIDLLIYLVEGRKKSID